MGRWPSLPDFVVGVLDVGMLLGEGKGVIGAFRDEGVIGKNW